MEQLYALEPTRKLLLSTSDSGLYAHALQNERLIRSTQLCSNYESDLSGVLYNNTLYYSYLTKERSLLVRCFGDATIVFRLDSTGNISYQQPQLLSFANTLLLSYIEQTDAGYVPKFRCLFTDLPPVSLPISAPASVIPQLRLLSTDTALYIFLSADTTSEVFRYNTSFSPEKLCTETEASAILQLPWKTEKNELQQKIDQLTEQLTQAQDELAQKSAQCTRLESMLIEQTGNLHTTKKQLAQTEHNLQQTQTLLERAKAQYDELMQVAERYRDEARKWYGKFSDRHSI